MPIDDIALRLRNIEEELFDESKLDLSIGTIGHDQPEFVNDSFETKEPLLKEAFRVVSLNRSDLTINCGPWYRSGGDSRTIVKSPSTTEDSGASFLPSEEYVKTGAAEEIRTTLSLTDTTEVYIVAFLQDDVVDSDPVPNKSILPKTELVFAYTEDFEYFYSLEDNSEITLDSSYDDPQQTFKVIAEVQLVINATPEAFVNYIEQIHKGAIQDFMVVLDSTSIDDNGAGGSAHKTVGYRPSSTVHEGVLEMFGAHTIGANLKTIPYIDTDSNADGDLEWVNIDSSIQDSTTALGEDVTDSRSLETWAEFGYKQLGINEWKDQDGVKALYHHNPTVDDHESHQVYYQYPAAIGLYWGGAENGYERDAMNVDGKGGGPFSGTVDHPMFLLEDNNVLDDGEGNLIVSLMGRAVEVGDGALRISESQTTTLDVTLPIASASGDFWILGSTWDVGCWGQSIGRGDTVAASDEKAIDLTNSRLYPEGDTTYATVCWGVDYGDVSKNWFIDWDGEGQLTGDYWYPSYGLTVCADVHPSFDDVTTLESDAAIHAKTGGIFAGDGLFVIGDDVDDAGEFVRYYLPSTAPWDRDKEALFCSTTYAAYFKDYDREDEDLYTTATICEGGIGGFFTAGNETYHAKLAMGNRSGYFSTSVNSPTHYVETTPANPVCSLHAAIEGNNVAAKLATGDSKAGDFTDGTHTSQICNGAHAGYFTNASKDAYLAGGTYAIQGAGGIDEVTDTYYANGTAGIGWTDGGVETFKMGLLINDPTDAIESVISDYLDNWNPSPYPGWFDHGELEGLDDDDHEQYWLVDGDYNRNTAESGEFINDTGSPTYTVHLACGYTNGAGGFDDGTRYAVLANDSSAGLFWDSTDIIDICDGTYALNGAGDINTSGDYYNGGTQGQSITNWFSGGILTGTPIEITGNNLQATDKILVLR